MEYQVACYFYAIPLSFLPLQVIYRNILLTSIYPNMWKLANVIPIFKKGDKQLIKDYRPIPLVPICGKILEKNDLQ